MQIPNNEIVIIELTGGKILNGSLVEYSSEIIVIYDGKAFVYIPIQHIHWMRTDSYNENNIQPPSDRPSFMNNVSNNNLTLPNILSHAKDIYVEILVTKNYSLHGVISAVFDDYFVFESPIYKTLLIPIKHLKFLIPLINQQPPYTLTEEEFFNYDKSKFQTYKTTFSSQINELKGQLVILNLGKDSLQIGKIINVYNNQTVMLNNSQTNIILNIDHIQTVQQV